MPEVKWIKITTSIFDDEKVKIIDTYPARDEILVIWFKLLTLSGKINENGMLFLSDKMPYTTEMLAAVFNREIKSVEMSLSIFEKLGMITIKENDVINIKNWEKHQNIDGLDKIRRQTRDRVKKHRKNKRLEACNATVTLRNATEEEKEKNKKEEKEKKLLCEFEKFWDLYDKKKNKKGCERKWKKLKSQDKEKIFKTLPEYIKSTPDKKFRKDPLTYLNQESWEDEIYFDNKDKDSSCYKPIYKTLEDLEI